LIANGEQSGTWGTTTNANLGTLIEDAISGYVSVSVISANQALTAVDGGADQSRNMIINLTTTTSAVFNVYIPPAEKFYVIRNSSAYDATIYCSTVLGNTTAAGTGVTVLAGTTTMVFADGTNVASSLTAFSGNLVVSANSSSPALRVTQTGSGNSILVEDSANPDATPFVVTATGDVGIGTTSPTNLLSVAGNANITGNTTLGDASTDTVTVNGYMGVGGAGASNKGMYQRNTALTGIGQYGVTAEGTFSSAATSLGIGFASSFSTEAAAFTMANAMGFRAFDIAKGAGSTITNQHGVYINDQTQGTNNYGITSLVSSGTNKWNIYASGTANNYFAGQLLLNTTSIRNIGSSPTNINVLTEGTGLNQSSMGAYANNTSAGTSGQFVFGRSRGTVVGAVTSVASGDWLGAITFTGADGTSGGITAAQIVAVVDGTPGTNDMPGRLVFSTTADGASSPTERMRIDSSGNVGIGTTTPVQPLEVIGAGLANRSSKAVNADSNSRFYGGAYTGNLATLAVLNGSLTNNSLFIGGGTSGGEPATVIGFFTGTVGATGTGTERMRIDSAGNLGLGVTPSAWVGTNVIEVSRLGTSIAAFSANNSYFTSNAYYNGTNWIYAATAAATYYQQTTGQHRWFNAPSGTAGNAITSTQAMTLDASGRLLVGTTAQGVYGGNTAEFRGANIATLGSNVTGNLTLFTTDSQAANIGAVLSLGGVYVGTTPYAFGAIAARKSNGTSGNAQGYLQFYTTNSDNSISEKLRIDSSGNVGIGTTSPAYNLEITGAASTAATLRVNGGSGANTNAVLDLTGRGSGNQFNNADIRSIGQAANGGILTLNTDDTSGVIQERMRIDSAGNVGIGTSSPAAELHLNTGFQVIDEGNFAATKFNSQGVTWSSVSTNPSLVFNGGATTRPEISWIRGANTYPEFSIRQHTTANSGGQFWVGSGSVAPNLVATVTTNAFLIGTGTSQSLSSGGVTGNLQIETANGSTNASMVRNTANATGPIFAFGKSRGAAFGSRTAVISNDVLGYIVFDGADGTNMVDAASIQAQVDGTPGTNDMPGRLLFSTTADGASTPTERMRLDSAGNLGLGVTPSAWSSSYRAEDIGTGGAIAYSSSGTDVWNNAFVSSTQNTYKTTSFATVYRQSATGQHQWYTAPSGTAGNAITFTQAMTLDASGRLLVGLTSTNSAFGGKLQVEGTSDAFASLVRYSSTAAGNPAFYFGRSKSATLGTNTIVASGDALGAIIFSGANGTGYSDAASIQGLVDGTPGASADMPGRLVFSTSADGSATPTERMRIDSSGNVGIGTTSPLTQLTNYSTTSAFIASQTTTGYSGFRATGTGGNFYFAIDNSTAGGFGVGNYSRVLWSDGAYPIVFATNAAERMRLDNAGNLGLGVTPSAWTASFDVMQLGIGGFIGGRASTVDEIYVGANCFFDTTDNRWEYIGTDVATQYYQDAGTHVWRTALSGTAGNAITWTQAMTLDASGNLGIGTTGPAAKLVSAGSESTVFKALILRNGNGSDGSSATIDFEASSGTQGSETAMAGRIAGLRTASGTTGALTFSTTNAGVLGERARITNVGNVKIGGTANRATTEGTNQLVMFNGTAPVGTLANGVSFYSASGEARVMDAAGNSTLLSPHDQATNEWIFHSKHTPTGKVLRIDVEKMLRFINDHFGLDMIQEFTEE
jgi:hypothetical protein